MNGYHLGDVIYGPDKKGHYPEKFYRPYSDYHNYIVAIPGNHDGDLDKLDGFMANFCNVSPSDAAVFKRAMPNQPGPYWHMKAPYLDLIGLFTNVDENIASLKSAGPNANSQIDWLKERLKEIAKERKSSGTRKALVIGTHHPPYNRGLTTQGAGHPGNPTLVNQLEEAFTAAKLYPDAVLSGHSHNYQVDLRDLAVGTKTRTIPYVVCGAGGIGLQATSTAIGNKVDDVTYVTAIRQYGYLTVSSSATTLRITFTQQDDTHRAPMHTISVDLATGKVT